MYLKSLLIMLTLMPAWLAMGQSNTFHLVGDATSIGNSCYRLTEAKNNEIGAIWNDDKINLQAPIDLSFQANFGTNDLYGADGIALVFHNDPAGQSATGGLGGNLGYTLIKPSFVVEFDTYYNGSTYGDMGHDHITCNIDAQYWAPLSPAVQANVSSINIEDGMMHDIRFTWDPASQQVSVYFDGALRQQHTVDLINTVFSGTTHVYWGVTSATGSQVNEQTVCFPCFNPNFQTALNENHPPAPGQFEQINSVKPTTDCGYIAAGYSKQLSNQDQLILNKLDKDGNLEWSYKYYDFSGGQPSPIGGRFEDVEQCMDGGYIMTGYVEYSNTDAVIIKTDPMGNVMWSTWVIEDPWIGGFDIEELWNGFYILTGYHGPDLMLMLIDPAGNTVWVKTYGRWFMDELIGHSIEPIDNDGDGVADDGFIVCGVYRDAVGSGDWDMLVAEFDASGGLNWAQHIVGNYEDIANSIKQIDVTGDGVPDAGKYAIAGWTNTPSTGGQHEAELVFVSSGAPNYQRVFFGSYADEELEAIEQTADGGFILAGKTNSKWPSPTDFDAMLVKTDNSGTISWIKEYGEDTGDDWAMSVHEVKDKGFVFGGVTKDFMNNWAGSYDMYIVKTDGAGDTDCDPMPRNFSSNSFPRYFNELSPNTYTWYANAVPMVNVTPEIDQWLCDVQGTEPPMFTTSLEEQATGPFGIEAFPNPTEGALNIRYTLNESGPVNALLTDLSGRIAKNWNLNDQAAGSHTLDANLDHLPVGIYFFSLKQGGLAQRLKIIVQ